MRFLLNKGFTLVELLVVITILAILGAIGFISIKGYSSQARDSTRIANIKKIELGSEIYVLKNSKPPIPDNFIDISFSGGLFLKQGYVGESVLAEINVSSDALKDPLTGDRYIYSTNDNQYSIVGYLEQDNLSLTNYLYADSLSDMYFYSRGTDAGVVLNENKTNIDSSLDIVSLSGSEKFNIVYNDGSFIGTKEQLKVLAVLNNKKLSNNDPSLSGYWPMDVITSDNRFLDESIYGNHCDIGINSIKLEKGFSGNAPRLDYDSYMQNIDCGSGLELSSRDFTISMFFKKDGFNPGYYDETEYGRYTRFLLKGPTTHTHYGIQLYDYGSKINLEYGLDPYDGVKWSKSSDLFFKDNKWENYIYTYDSDLNQLFLYKNGIFVEKYDNISLNQSVGDNFYLATGSTTMHRGFPGLIDEAKIYNRVLKEEEVKLIYNKYF